jgi:hypothetical protein
MVVRGMKQSVFHAIFAENCVGSLVDFLCELRATNSHARASSDVPLSP